MSVDITTFAFGDMAGTRIIMPVFAFGHGFLAWFSAGDCAVGLLRTDDHVKWINLPRELMGKWRPREVRVSPSTVYLNVYCIRPEVSEQAVIAVNLATGKSSILPGVLSLRCCPGSEHLALERRNGDIDLVERGKVLRTVHTERGIWDWDLSPSGETIGILDRRGTMAIIGPRGVRRWRVGLLHGGSRISMADALDRLWLSGDLPFSIGSNLHAFSLDGKNLGKAASSRFPFYRPIVRPDRVIMALLKRSDERTADD